MPLRPQVSDQDHIEGNTNALIELVEYGDYECPHCGSAYPVVKRIQKTFGNNLKFVFRNFPLSNIHPYAALAAIATEAAALQGRYWPMHDLIFEHQDRLNRDSLLAFAQELELDLHRFRIDLGSLALLEKVEADFESGVRSGVNATPTFFINGEKYNNRWEGENMLDFITEKYAHILAPGG